MSFNNEYLINVKGIYVYCFQKASWSTYKHFSDFALNCTLCVTVRILKQYVEW